MTWSPTPRSRRDRHGRGRRGPLAPSHLPLTLTAAARFDETVLQAAERLERMWPVRTSDFDLTSIDIAVSELPPSPVLDAAQPGSLRLGDANPGPPAEVVLYRRPIEHRSETDSELTALIRNVLAELIAELVGLPPDALDPGYR